MAAASGSASNAARALNERAQRTVFTFSFPADAKSRVDKGVEFEHGTTIKKIAPGSAAARKGLRVGWTIVACDSCATTTEKALRAAVAKRANGKSRRHFYSVQCRVDETSAAALRVKRRKDLLQTLKRFEAGDGFDLRDLEAHRDGPTSGPTRNTSGTGRRTTSERNATAGTSAETSSRTRPWCRPSSRRATRRRRPRSAARPTTSP